MRTNYDYLFRLYELRTLGVLVDSTIVETSTTSVFGPSGDEIILEL